MLNKPSKGEVIIFDRFICATQIKFNSLGYQNSWFRFLWNIALSKNTFYMNVDVPTSVARQKSRGDDFTYSGATLSIERKHYLNIARRFNLKIVNGLNGPEFNRDVI